MERHREVHSVRERMLFVFLMTGGTAFFCLGAYSQNQPQKQPMFTQYERQLLPARPSARCQPSTYETPITYSKLTLSDQGEAVYEMWEVTPCLGQKADPPWRLRWEAGDDPKSVFRYKLSASEF